MSEAVLSYEPPEGARELADRIVDGKTIILYVGEVATLDVVEIDEHKEPTSLLFRVPDVPPGEAMDLLTHPHLYIPREEAASIFGDPRAH